MKEKTKIEAIKNLADSIIYDFLTGGAKPVTMNLITIDKIINNVKAEPNGIYYTTDTNEVYMYTTDKIWVKLADKIFPEARKKKYTNKQLKCPSCGAPHKETEEKCYWCGYDFVLEE